MSRVYVFLADGFEEIEGLTAVDLLRRAGCEVKTVSVMGRREIMGSHQIGVTADILFEEMTEKTADLLVLPGGMPGTNHLRDHAGLAGLLMKQYSSNGLLAAICAAPMVFEGLGFLKDRDATSYPGCIGENTGRVLEQPVVQDGHVITSRGVGTAIPFALKLIEVLKGSEKAQEIAEAIVYSSQRLG